MRFPFLVFGVRPGRTLEELFAVGYESAAGARRMAGKLHAQGWTSMRVHDAAGWAA